MAKKEINNEKQQKRPYQNEAAELRKWLHESGKFSSIREFADYLQINYKTVSGWFIGHRRPSDEKLKKLREITGLDIFTSETNKKRKKKISSKKDINSRKEFIQGLQNLNAVTDTMKKEISFLLKNTKTTDEADFQDVIISSENINDRITNIRNLLYLLGEELNYFKSSTQKDRHLLKQKVPAMDVGYVVSFLRAVYDEDAFQDWLFFSDYELRGGGINERKR